MKRQDDDTMPPGPYDDVPGDFTAEKKPVVLSELRSQSQGKGIRCRKCGCPRLRVYYTRARQDSIKRVRVCENCGTPRVTFEKPA